MDEKQIVERILEMGAESLNPDMYIQLEEICSDLRARRKALSSDDAPIVEVTTEETRTGWRNVRPGISLSDKEE